MRIKMERMAEKLKYLESGRKWNSQANEKQFIYQCKLRSIVVEDFRLVLENYFGEKNMEVPRCIEEAVKRGEKKIEERIKMLRLANKASWLDVDKYVTDPMCSTEEDDRKWKKAVREAKEEAENKRKGSFGSRGQTYGQKDGYRKREDGRNDSRDDRDGQSKKEGRTCHRCGKIGHLRAQCRGRNDGRP